MPMLLRNADVGTAIVATGVRGSAWSVTRLNSCSSKFSVPKSTNRLNELVVASVNWTVAPAP